MLPIIYIQSFSLYKHMQTPVYLLYIVFRWIFKCNISREYYSENYSSWKLHFDNKLHLLTHYFLQLSEHILPGILCHQEKTVRLTNHTEKIKHDGYFMNSTHVYLLCKINWLVHFWCAMHPYFNLLPLFCLLCHLPDARFPRFSLF